jgi:hypothetical protein
MRTLRLSWECTASSVVSVAQINNNLVSIVESARCEFNSCMYVFSVDCYDFQFDLQYTYIILFVMSEYLYTTCTQRETQSRGIETQRMENEICNMEFPLLMSANFQLRYLRIGVGIYVLEKSELCCCGGV